MKIGIDIGNVIIGGGGDDTFFTEQYLQTPEVEGAWNSILALMKAGHEIHVISKCGPTTEEKSVKWLNESGFMYVLKSHRLHFVRKRPLKAPMAQALELDIFIDDREDIINTMTEVGVTGILFTSWEQTNKELEELGA